MLCHQQLLTGLFFLLQEDNKNFITLVAKHGEDVGVRDRRLRSHLLELGTLGVPQHRAHCWGDWGRAPRSSWRLFHRTAGALGDAAQFGSGPKGKTRAQESLMPRELKLP